MGTNIELDLLKPEGNNIVETLKEGIMVVARSEDSFLYMVEDDQGYMLYAHTPGAPQGGQKQLPKDEKNEAIIKNIASVSDRLFSVKYDADMNVFGVMVSAERAILESFPPASEGGEQINFVIPGQE